MTEVETRVWRWWNGGGLAATTAAEGEAQFFAVVEEVFFLAALCADAVRDLGVGAFDSPVVLAALGFRRLNCFAGTRASIGLAFSHCNHPFAVTSLGKA